MNKSLIALLIVAVGGLLGVTGQTQALAGDPPRAQTTSRGRALYKPPMLGAPKVRVGGGVRGAEENDAPVLQVLAPLHTGQTAMEQPILYWHLDKPVPHVLEITVMEEGGVSPLAREFHPGPAAQGLHAFRLAKHNVRLAHSKEYEWFVAIIRDPAQRSMDIIASGGLRRVPVPADLQRQLGTARQGDAGLIYAAAGLWYDAIDALVAGHGTVDAERVNGQFTTLLHEEEITEIDLTVPAEQ